MYFSQLRKRSAISQGVTIGVVVIIVIAAGVAAYATIGGGLTPSTTTSTVTATKTLTTTTSAAVKLVKVALIMEGPQLDASFNQIIATDLASIVNSSKGTVQAQYIDNINPPDFVRTASTFAQQGVNLVVADSNDYAAACAQVAPLFPNTYFGCYGGNVAPGTNLGAFVVWANEAAYVEGYLAGLMTKTNKVGDIVAFKSASQIAFTNGFMQGVLQAAKERNVSITVTNGWTNTFTDPSIGQQSANAMLSSGIDIIAEDASGPGAGMQNAVKQAYKDSTVGPFAMGAFVNQNNLGPFMISSTPWDFTASLQSMIQQVRDGTFGNKITQFFMHDGNVSVVMSSTVPPAIQTKINALIRSIMTGTKVIPLVSSPDLMPSGTITVP